MLRYPYVQGDRLVGLQLDNDLEASHGPTPPSGAAGGAGQYKLWMDTSTAPPTLRMATSGRAAAGSYVNTDWGALGTINLGTRRFTYQGEYFVADVGYEFTNAGHYIYDVGGGVDLNFRVGPSGGGFAYFTMTDQGVFIAQTGLEVGGNQHYIYDVGSPVALNFRLGTSGPFFTMNSNGGFYAGSFTINQTGHSIYDASGTLNFEVGPVGGPYNYFSMHPNGDFQVNGNLIANNITAGANIKAANLFLTASPSSIFFAGGVSTPVIAGDNVNFRFQLGSGNGLFFFDDNAGAQLFNISSNGNTNTSGVASAAAFVTSGNEIYDTGTALNFRVGPVGGPYSYYTMGRNDTFYAPVAFSLISGTHAMYNASGTLNFNVGNGAAYFSMRPAGNFDAPNDVVAGGTFRQSDIVVGGTRGARIECFAGDWGSMQFGMTTGHLSVSPDGGVSGFIFNSDSSYSDARLKENVRDTDVDALEMLRQTPVRAFEWNAKGRELMPWARSVECGLVAQELEETIPVATGTAPFADEPMYINDQNLTPYLIRAIQQIADRLDAGGL